MSEADLFRCKDALLKGLEIKLPPEAVEAATAAAARFDRESSPNNSGRKSRKGKLVLALLILLGGAALFASQSDYCRYSYASFQDTPEAYSKAMTLFPNSPHRVKAKRRYLELTDNDAWATAQANGSLTSVRSYLKEYPQGKHHDEAKEVIFNLAVPLWLQTSRHGTLVEIEGFGRLYPEVAERIPTLESLDLRWQEAISSERFHDVTLFRTLPVQVAARWPVQQYLEKFGALAWQDILKARSVSKIQDFETQHPLLAEKFDSKSAIKALYNDAIWVRQQDTLEHYRRFVEENPRHRDTPGMQKRIIDLEVIEIAEGDHGELPKAQSTGKSRKSVNSSIKVKNDTGYELTVRFSGTDSQKLVIPEGKAASVTLLNGSYKVAASVNTSSVRNYFGTDEFQGGNYDSSFYISREPFSGLPPFSIPGRR